MNNLYLGGHLRQFRVGHLVLLDSVQEERDAAGVEELQMFWLNDGEREHLHVFELGRQRAFDHLRLRVFLVLIDAVLDVQSEGEARLEHLGRPDRHLKQEWSCTSNNNNIVFYLAHSPKIQNNVLYNKNMQK